MTVSIIYFRYRINMPSLKELQRRQNEDRALETLTALQERLDPLHNSELEGGMDEDAGPDSPLQQKELASTPLNDSSMVQNSNDMSEPRAFISNFQITAQHITIIEKGDRTPNTQLVNQILDAQTNKNRSSDAGDKFSILNSNRRNSYRPNEQLKLIRAKTKISTKDRQKINQHYENKDQSTLQKAATIRGPDKLKFGQKSSQDNQQLSSSSFIASMVAKNKPTTDEKEFSMKEYQSALASKISQMTREFNKQKAKEALNSIKSVSQEPSQAPNIEDEIQEEEQQQDDFDLTKRIRRHQFKNKYITFDDYQIFYQEQTRRKKADEDHLFYRRAGKQKLPKTLVDQDNRKKRDVAILKKVMIQKAFSSPFDEEDPNLDQFSEVSGRTNMSTQSQAKRKNRRLAKSLRQYSFVEESETTSDSEHVILSDDESKEESEVNAQGASKSKQEKKLERKKKRREQFKKRQQELLKEDDENSDGSHFDEFHRDASKLVQNKQPDLFIFSPDSMIRATWDLVLFVFLIYQAFTLPLRIAFEIQSTPFTFNLEVAIDIMFIMDIFMNFFTGYYDRNQKVMKRAKIAYNYLQFWFWIDLVSSIPFTWILAWSQGLSIQQIEEDNIQEQAQEAVSSEINPALTDAPQLLKLLKIAKLLKILKLLRVMKLKKLMNRFDEFVVSDSMDLIVTFFNITLKIIVIAHYMSCLFFYVGMEEVRAGKEGWILSMELLKEPLGTQYITSMYWAFTTMSAVGYGDITPKTENERVITLVMMMFSCGIFAYTVNSIGNIVQRFNRIATSFREKMMYVNRYFAQKKMPDELRLKVRRYLDYVFETKQDIKVNENEVQQLLNERLGQKLQLTLRGRVVGNMRMFKSFGLEFMTEVTQMFISATYVIDDFIFMEQDKAECLYYIQDGKISMIHKASHTYLKDLKQDQFVGEVGMFRNMPRCLSAKVRDFTHVYILMATDIFRLAELYTKALKAVKRIEEDLWRDQYSSVHTRCYLCNSQNHLALQCKRFTQKYKGNLIKMYFQNKNGGINEADNDEEMKKQIKKFRMYQEAHIEQKVYQTSDSEGTIKLKDDLIQKVICEKENVSNGHLMNLVIEYPKQVMNVLEKEDDDVAYRFFHDTKKNSEVQEQLTTEMQKNIKSAKPQLFKSKNSRRFSQLMEEQSRKSETLEKQQSKIYSDMSSNEIMSSSPSIMDSKTPTKNLKDIPFMSFKDALNPSLQKSKLLLHTTDKISEASMDQEQDKISSNSPSNDLQKEDISPQKEQKQGTFIENLTNLLFGHKEEDIQTQPLIGQDASPSRNQVRRTYEAGAIPRAPLNVLQPNSELGSPDQPARSSDRAQLQDSPMAQIQEINSFISPQNSSIGSNPRQRLLNQRMVREVQNSPNVLRAQSNGSEANEDDMVNHDLYRSNAVLEINDRINRSEERKVEEHQVVIEQAEEASGSIQRKKVKKKTKKVKKSKKAKKLDEQKELYKQIPIEQKPPKKIKEVVKQAQHDLASTTQQQERLFKKVANHLKPQAMIRSKSAMRVTRSKKPDDGFKTIPASSKRISRSNSQGREPSIGIQEAIRVAELAQHMNPEQQKIFTEMWLKAAIAAAGQQPQRPKTSQNNAARKVIFQRATDQLDSNNPYMSSMTSWFAPNSTQNGSNRRQGQGLRKSRSIGAYRHYATFSRSPESGAGTSQNQQRLNSQGERQAVRPGRSPNSNELGNVFDESADIQVQGLRGGQN